MSHLVDKLMSRSGLVKTVVVGATLVASVAAHAAVADTPVALSAVADSAVQTQAFDTLDGFVAVPLSVAEADSFDAERIRLRVKVFGVKIGTILMGSRYRGPHFDGSLNCIVVPSPSGVAPRCALSH